MSNSNIEKENFAQDPLAQKSAKDGSHDYENQDPNDTSQCEICSRNKKDPIHNVKED